MTKLPLAYRNTVKFTSRPGSALRFRFIGTGFRYVYTGAINRGSAEILIDGIHNREVDLYSHNNAWQTPITIADFPGGLHRVEIRATGHQNSLATGHFVDVDSIEIFDDTKAPPGSGVSN